MLAANVLCMKKKKRKTYCLPEVKVQKKNEYDRTDSRTSGGAVTMLQITEDTPPDMLSGAMDLTVHLPNGKAVKMAVERSTPMMDLLVQITAKHQLQLSNYTLQALGMAPSVQHSDTILPYKPNTPIGTLDTQHIKVVPKSRSIPVPKNAAPGHQPFESTFRLKVHLPRNQLYVTRVSRNVLLEDIMREVCQEKNLNPSKYEFKHPANPDEVLDPKWTLSDYQITEIYLVLKGTLTQAFSTTDIMALRKEEVRKQMHNKTGGGVFNLIFRRGKSSMGSGSTSSENRSISPTHSDDSRSVTPPNPPPVIAPPPKNDPPLEKPKPPQRKRRPAPKPPAVADNSRRNSEEKPPSTVSESSGVPQQVEQHVVRKTENSQTIGHSRNSSDSSGYHEASVLSENCNTSLPRRPKSAFVTSGEADKLSKLHSQSSTNLTKMTTHSKSTTSLAIAGRKKKAAPPPPPLVRASNPAINIETPSCVVASQPVLIPKDLPATQESIFALPNPSPIARSRSKAPPQPTPRKLKDDSTQSSHEKQPTMGEGAEIHRNLENVVISELKEICATNDVKYLEVGYPVGNDSTEIHSENVNTYSDNNNLDSNDTKTFIEMAHRDYSDVQNGNIDTKKEDGLLLTHIAHFPELGEINLHTPPINSKVAKVDNEAIIDELLKELQFESCSSEAVAQSAKTIDKQDVNNNKDSSSLTVTDISEEAGSLSIDENKNRTLELGQYQTFGAQDMFKSNEFLHKRPPEIVALIPKTPKTDEYRMSGDSPGSIQVKIGPHIGYSFEDPIKFLDRGLTPIRTDFPFSSLSTPLKSCDSADLISDNEDDIWEHENFDSYNQFHEKQYRRKKISVSSLRSTNSLYDFVGGTGLKKWNNIEDLDHDSLTSLGPNNKWVVGDSFGPESLVSQQALDSLSSLSIGNVVDQENKCFGSTDSGIAQETVEKISEPDDVPSISPPPPPLPPPLLEEQPQPLKELVLHSTAISEPSPVVLPAPQSFSQEITGEHSSETHPDSSLIPLSNNISLSADSLVILPDVNNLEPEISEIDWHYQLPSPPRAFRDSSPNPVAIDNSESQSSADFKDSVVTSPELFEKLKNIEDIQFEKETMSSDLTSIVSEEEKPPLLNTLSLENLEKRKSLVYNRVLATSLKMTDTELADKVNEAETFSSSLTKFESAFSEIQNSSQMKATAETKFVKKSNVGTHTLPNFKISAYDKPKQNIKVFEDDTIRSNTDNINKDISPSAHLGLSTEKISKRKHSIDNHSSYSNEEREYHFYKQEGRPPKSSDMVMNMSRSELFSRNSVWSPIKPVSRSKSNLTLNGNKFKETAKEEAISRSNSLYDGLQSLGVMRLIQNKLNTPTSSIENIAVNYNQPTVKPSILAAEDSPKAEVFDKDGSSSAAEKQYRYRGPPSVNMSTWSERPKIPVAVKEDSDYKLGKNNSKLIVNTTNNSIISSNTVEVRNKTENSSTVDLGLEPKHSSDINIKVNGSDTVNHPAKNVVIKIGSQQPKVLDNQEFTSHATTVGYRKPFTTINSNQRPHSIAFDSDFDISRVPVVRSLELKKPFKDNTSVTHINQSKFISKEPVSELLSKFSAMNKSTETLPKKAHVSRNSEDKESRPVSRANSLRPQIVPVVRGFNSIQDNKISNRFSWSTNNSYNTLPVKSKEKDDFLTNKHVPFSQSNLRRTESSKIVDKNMYNKAKDERCVNLVIDTNSYHSLPVSEQEFKPPPPPSMAKLKPTKREIEPPVVDPRDQLMSAIRNFGGKKGLKTVKT